MPATVATPAERRNGWTGPVTRSMNSGQWSIASSRPLPSLSSAKSFVPKPLALVLPASNSRSLNETVDDLSVVALTKSKCTASTWLQGLLMRPRVAKASSWPTGSPMDILSPRTMHQSGGMKETTAPKLTSFLSLIPKSILKALGVSGWVLVTVRVSAGLKSALALSVRARTSRRETTPTSVADTRSLFALTTRLLSWVPHQPASSRLLRSAFEETPGRPHFLAITHLCVGLSIAVTLDQPRGHCAPSPPARTASSAVRITATSCTMVNSFKRPAIGRLSFAGPGLACRWRDGDGGRLNLFPRPCRPIPETTVCSLSERRRECMKFGHFLRERGVNFSKHER